MTSSFSKYTKSVNCMSFSNNSDYLLTCSNDYQAKILKTNPLRVITFLNGHTDIINSCCFTNFTQKVLTGSADRQIKIWDIYKGSTSEKVCIFYYCLSILMLVCFVITMQFSSCELFRQSDSIWPLRWNFANMAHFVENSSQRNYRVA